MSNEKSSPRPTAVDLKLAQMVAAHRESHPDGKVVFVATATKAALTKGADIGADTKTTFDALRAERTTIGPNDLVIVDPTFAGPERLDFLQGVQAAHIVYVGDAVGFGRPTGYVSTNMRRAADLREALTTELGREPLGHEVRDAMRAVRQDKTLTLETSQGQVEMEVPQQFASRPETGSRDVGLDAGGL